MTKATKRKPAETGRNLFDELVEGFEALEDSRTGKKTLRTHAVPVRRAPTITPEELRALRAKLNMSRAVFATYLRVNTRTLENWEQGRAKPNAQAALLINLVAREPETIRLLAEV